MDDIKGFLKANWPYVLGGVIGLFLVMRYMSGGSSSGGGTVMVDSAGNAQLAMQGQALQAQVDAQKSAQQLERDKIQAQVTSANQQFQLGTQTIAANLLVAQGAQFNELETTRASERLGINTNQVNYQTASANLAQAVGASTSGMIGALYAPSIAAINATSYENGIALGSAATIAANSFGAQASIVGTTNNAIAAAGGTVASWGNALRGMGSIVQAPNNQSRIAGSISEGVQSYFSGGMSSMGKS